MADDEQLQHDLDLLAAELKQWKKRWDDPLLLLRRSYQLLVQDLGRPPRCSSVKQT